MTKAGDRFKSPLNGKIYTVVGDFDRTTIQLAHYAPGYTHGILATRDTLSKWILIDKHDLIHKYNLMTKGMP